jgi:hypothetical protein
VKKVKGGIVMSQKKYVSEIIKRAGMEKCKVVNTPLSSSEKVSSYKGDPLSAKDATKYRSIVGALPYLTLTRSNLAYSVNKACQFLHAPTTNHMILVKRILRYVQRTIDLSLRIRRDKSLRINAFSDVDWAGCPDDRCSTGDFAIYLRSNMLSWSACKLATVSRSSTEAEYKSLANATTEVIWVQTIMRELGINQSKIPCLWCDNLEATYMTANPVFHARTKHIEIDYHFVRERVASKQLNIRIIASKDQIAYEFAKALLVRKFLEFRYSLNLGSCD